ncbi:MAG TPA: hypothetical protein VEJ16_01780 [Alphaproteobacteria bacterium]|nr:hypothetical protein [Alphaproteobacteria bacterium]
MDRHALAGLIAAAIKRGSPLVTEAAARTIADAVLQEMIALQLNVVDHAGHSVVQEQKTDERRREKRERTLRHGKIIYSGNSCMMDCLVLDLTEGGARIKPADIMICPEEFVLKIQYSALRNCEVVWRKNTELGVRFY